MTQLNTEDCARILLATTSAWSAADGTAAVVEDARGSLARVIIASGGRGFPQPAAVPAGGPFPPAWQSCVAAAEMAARSPADSNTPANVVFWKPDPNNPMNIANDLKTALQWPFAAGSMRGNVSGALRESSGVIKRLYFFTAIDPSALALDGDAGPGWWPRAGRLLAMPADAQAQTNLSSSFAPKPKLAATLMVLWLILAAIAAIGIFCVGHPPDAKAWWSWCAWIKADKGDFDLVPAFLLMMSSLTALVLAAGLGLKGLWFGVLIDEHNRISLARTQQVAWTVLVLAALAVVGWFNAGIIDWLAQPTAGTAIHEMFPSLDAALWAALGINLALTPLLSSQILTVKAQGAAATQDPATPAPAASPVITPAALDRNDSPAQASWIDLITGETAGKDGMVDVSRLQQVIISGLLLSGYLVALVGQLSVVAGNTVIAALAHIESQGTFLGLLAFSHASYLVFKARAKAQPAPTPPAAAPAPTTSSS